MDRLPAKHLLADIARLAFPGYRGRKFEVIISDRPRRLVSYWDGGSRDEFVAVQGAKVFRVPTRGALGEDAPDYVPVPGTILVERSIFMGKDSGCKIYLHPADAEMSG